MQVQKKRQSIYETNLYAHSTAYSPSSVDGESTWVEKSHGM